MLTFTCGWSHKARNVLVPRHEDIFGQQVHHRVQRRVVFNDKFQVRLLYRLQDAAIWKSKEKNKVIGFSWRLRCHDDAEKRHRSAVVLHQPARRNALFFPLALWSLNISPEAVRCLTTRRHNHFSNIPFGRRWPRCNAPLGCRHHFHRDKTDDVQVGERCFFQKKCHSREQGIKVWATSVALSLFTQVPLLSTSLPPHKPGHQHQPQTPSKGRITGRFHSQRTLASFKLGRCPNLSPWQG